MRHLSLLIAVAFLVGTMPPASAQGAGEGRIRILGRATIETMPDHVSVRVGITNKAASPTAALDQNSAVARKIIEFAKKFGIEAKDVQTDSINLAPAFKTVRDPNGTTRQEPDGYTASNIVRVKLADMSRLGTFMRDVLDQGATNIGGVQFGLSHPEKILDEARAKAIEDAFRQARLVAEAAKVKLGPVRDIVHPPRTQRADGLADMPVQTRGAQVGAQVPVEVGSVRIGAEVEITWTIE
jgi:uncharacterized protein YggE